MDSGIPAPHRRLRRTTRTPRACEPARIGRAVHYPIDEPGMRIPRAEISGQTHQSINNTKNKMQNQVGFSFNAKMAEWEKSFPFIVPLSDVYALHIR